MKAARQEIDPEILEKVRGLGDEKLTRLISEISDGGWKHAEHAFFPAAKRKDHGHTMQPRLNLGE